MNRIGEMGEIFLKAKSDYSTGNERQTPTGGTISEQIYLGFTVRGEQTNLLNADISRHS